jgi:ABC-2 type transport system permease protein
MKSFSKYLAVFRMGFADSLEYRFNLFTEVLLWYFPLIVQVLLWKAVYLSYGQESLGGYTYPQMITYCLGVMIVFALIRTEGNEWSVIGDIRDGTLQRYLLQPVDFLLYRIILVASKKIVIIGCIIVNVTPALLLFPGSFHLSITLAQVPAFCLAVTCSLLIQFLMQTTIALFSFWFTEFTSIFHFLPFIFTILDGTAFPLDLLPAWLNGVLSYTPFPYTVFFPTRMLVGGMDRGMIVQGLCMQLIWVAACLFLCKLVWSRGIRRFSATGG